MTDVADLHRPLLHNTSADCLHSLGRPQLACIDRFHCADLRADQKTRSVVAVRSSCAEAAD